MRPQVGLSTMVVGLTIHFAYNVSTTLIITTVRHGSNSYSYSRGNNFLNT